MFGIPMVLDIIPSFIKVHTIETRKSSHPIHWEHNLGHEEFAWGCELKVRITKSSTNVVSLFCQFSTVLTFFLWETNLWILSLKVRFKVEFFDPMFLRPGTWCKSTLGQVYIRGMPKWVWSSMNRYRIFFVQTSTLPPHMHQKLTKHGRFCKHINQLPTKSHDELKDNSSVRGNMDPKQPLDGPCLWTPYWIQTWRFISQTRREKTFENVWTNHLSKNNKGCTLVGTKKSNDNNKSNNTTTSTLNSCILFSPITTVCNFLI